MKKLLIFIAVIAILTLGLTKNKIEAGFLENAKKISIKAKETSPVKSDKKDLVKTIKETSVKNKNKKTSSQTINEMKALLGTLGPEEEIDTILKKIFNKWKASREGV